jgi:hypothetical protein
LAKAPTGTRHIYVSYEEPSDADRARPRNGPRNASFDVAFKDARLPIAAQFEVTPGGGRSGRAISCALDVPPVTGVSVDGRTDDWTGRGLRLGLSEDRGSVRLGWSPDGLLALVTLPADFSAGSPLTALRLQLVGPASPTVLEAVIDTATRRVETLEASLAPAGEGKTRDLAPFRETRPAGLPTAAGEAGGELVAEFLFPLDRLGARPAPSTRLGLKLVAFDPESPDGNIATGGGSRRALAEACDVLVLALADRVEQSGRVKAGPAGREWYGELVRHSPAPVPLPNDTWSGAGVDDGRGISAEIAVPLSTLDALGLRREGMRVIFETDGRLQAGAQALRAAFSRSRRIVLRPPDAAGGTWTVRLHFAELDGARPGERVFEIRLQGKTVAEAVDVAREAGGPLRGLVRTFTGVVAGRVLEIELVPKQDTPWNDALPTLSGIEVVPEMGPGQ